MQPSRVRQVYESWYGTIYKINYYIKEEKEGGGKEREEREEEEEGKWSRKGPAAACTVTWQEELRARLIYRLSLEGSTEPIRAVLWEATGPRVSSEGRLTLSYMPFVLLEIS